MLGVRPLRLSLYARFAVPDPTDRLGVELVSDDGPVPHSNQASVSEPLGFTLPFRVALSVVMDVAEAVVTEGGVPVVVKLCTEPLTVTAEFDAAIR